MNNTELLETVTFFMQNVTENTTTAAATSPVRRIGSAAFSTSAFWYQVILAPIGLITNILTLICLRTFHKGKLNIYLTALAILDALFSANLLIATYYRTLRWTGYYFAAIYAKTIMPLGACYGGIGNWITILIAVDRVVHVVFPLKARVWVTENMAKLIVCITIIVFSILRMPYFFIFSTSSATLPSGEKVYWASWDSFFFSTLGQFLFTAQAIIFDYIPCIALALLNIIIMIFLHRYQQKRRALTAGQFTKDSVKIQKETRMTITLWLLIILNIIGNVPLNLTRIIFLRPFEGLVWKEIASFLFIVDRVSNFFIYVFSNPEFRECIQQNITYCPGCAPPKPPSYNINRKMSTINKDHSETHSSTGSTVDSEVKIQANETSQEIFVLKV